MKKLIQILKQAAQKTYDTGNENYFLGDVAGYWQAMTEANELNKAIEVAEKDDS